MNDLFIQPIEFEKVSYARVSENPAEWTGNVMERFYSQFPFFANSPVSVNLTEKDESRGYAMGSIKIEEGEGMVVPIIIQARELFPFDVCIVKGTVMPLTNTTLNLYIQSRGAFLRVVKPDAGDPTNALFNTSFGQQITPTYVSDQYKTASIDDSVALWNKLAQEEDEETKKHEASESKAFEKKEDKREEKKDKKEDKKESEGDKREKNASVIDRISSTISEEARHNFFTTLAKSASIVEGFKRNGTQSVILKLAAVNPTKHNFNDKVRKDLERDIHYIYKAASHDYRGVFGNSKVNDPIELCLDAEAAAKFEDIKTPATYDMPKVANNNELYGVISCSIGTMAVLDNMDYVLLPPQYNHMEKFANVNVAKIWKERAVEPEITKKAMWSHTTSFAPFEIIRIYKDNGRERIETTDGLTKRAFCRMQGIDYGQIYTVENGITYLPADAKIIKLGNQINIAETTLANPSYTNEVIRMDENAFMLKGAEFSRYAKSDSREYDLHRTNWHVIQCGGTKEDVEKIAQLAPGKSYVIPHEMHVPIEFDKVAQKMRNEYETQIKTIRNIAVDFIKEASAITDTPTVDAVLSLNFVNRENITEFANALPMFADVSNKLADMLLKTRVGVRIVDENVLRRVMLGIVDIIDVLSGVANLANKK